MAAAYEVLSDKEKRRVYDTQGEEGTSAISALFRAMRHPSHRARVQASSAWARAAATTTLSTSSRSASLPPSPCRLPRARDRDCYGGAMHRALTHASPGAADLAGLGTSSARDSGRTKVSARLSRALASRSPHARPALCHRRATRRGHPPRPASHAAGHLPRQSLACAYCQRTECRRP